MKNARPGTGFSRRQWVAVLTGALVPLAGRAQAPAAPPLSELDARRDSLRLNQNAIRRARVPRETEPAFHFEA